MTGTIAPHILVLSIVFSIGWGWYLVDEINSWLMIRISPTRTKAQVGEAFRSLIAAICLESVCLAYVVRTGFVLAGAGDEAAGQLVFFILLGINMPGFIFAVASRKLD